MKTRRYSITKEQAEIIRLALYCFIEELNNMIETGTEIGNNCMYEKYRREQAKMVKESLDKYQWEVQK